MVNEDALIEKLLAGDEAAFLELVTTMHGPMTGLAMKFVRDRAQAEEVVQDTWLAVLKGLPGFERRCSLKSWVYRILVNRSKSRGVREARTSSFSDLGPDEKAAIDPMRFHENGRWNQPPPRWQDDTPEAALERENLKDRLRRAIETLPENQRAVLILRDVEGIETEEICNILDITETNQRVLLHRARATLYQVMETELGLQVKSC